ncbi:MAG: hypothetical protein JW958_08230 [Candidatus Eisenbacteria bacterium]|nr:hypothetical protein [Candidatus Eisenbacteria bacterium]
MRPCRKNIVLLPVLLSLILGAASAGEMEKKVEGMGFAFLTRERLDCSSAIPIATDTVLMQENRTAPNNVTNYSCSPGLDQSGGERVYRVDLVAETRVTVTLDPADCDLDLWLVRYCDEAYCSEYSAGVDQERLDLCLDDGEWYFVVDGYGGASGDYTVSFTFGDCGAPQEGETCAFPLDLCAYAGGDFEIPYSTLLAEDDYSTDFGGCTGYTAHGGDIVYSVTLDPGGLIDVTQTGDYDMVLYLVTDCEDVVGSCVAGSDNCCSGIIETVTYTSEFGGTYYLIVDGYTGEGSGSLVGTVTGCAGVASENESWGGVKNRFR